MFCTRTCEAGYPSDGEWMARLVFDARIIVWRVRGSQSRGEEKRVQEVVGLLVVDMRVWRSDRIHPFDETLVPRFVVVDQWHWCRLFL